MMAPTLENNIAKLTLLDLSNYEHLTTVASQDKLVQFSPSKIDTPEDLKTYVQDAVDGYYHKTTIPFIIYDKRPKKEELLKKIKINNFSSL